MVILFIIKTTTPKNDINPLFYKKRIIKNIIINFFAVPLVLIGTGTLFTITILLACCIWLGMKTHIGQCIRCPNGTSDPQRQNSIENENYIEMNVLPSTSHDVDLTLPTVAVIEVHTANSNCSTNDIGQPVEKNCSTNDIGQSVQYRDGQIKFMLPTGEHKCLSTNDSAMLNFNNIEFDNFLPN
jgi:hypothetical protein